MRLHVQNGSFILSLCGGDTHVVGRAVFSVQRFGDKHLSEHRVYIEDLVGWLICSHPGDAVPDRDVLILVGTNLQHKEQHTLSLTLQYFYVCISL